MQRSHVDPTTPDETPASSGALVISLDFELFWGVRDTRTLEGYRGNLLGVRDAIPRLLDLFAEYGIHATWATVGFLFFDGRDDLLENAPAVRPRYRVRELDPYAVLPALGRSEREDPFHFAPSLIRLIRSYPGQEIGTHTFSHFYCLEEGQDEAAFAADLEAAARAAGRFGVTLESIVFPRNQINEAYLDTCRAAGLVAYRGTEESWLHRPSRRDDHTAMRRALRLADAYLPISGVRSERPSVLRGSALVNVRSSRFLRPYTPLLATGERLRRARVVNEMRAAAAQRGIYHLWWHPHNFGSHIDENLRMLREVLEGYRRLAGDRGFRTASMAEIAAEVRGDVAVERVS